MKDWTTALPDWERRITAGGSLIPCPPLFPAEAEDALGTFGSLRMVDAVGSPLMAEVVRPWVSEFVASIFGAYDPETGRRLIQEYLLLISKKNGKSTIAAGIMLTALIRNWRASGEFIILAPTVEIANNSFNPARDMVASDDELKDLLHVQEHIRTITHRETRATLKVVAADSDTVGGKKAIGVFVDELWLFGKRPNAEAMLREATGGLASRPEGFVIYATTQSDDPPAGVFKSKLQYARGVRDGRIDDRKFLPVLYEFPPAMVEAGEHRKPENARITNPNLGLSVDEEFITRGFMQAQEDGESSFRGFLAKHLNVEIGQALMSDNWAGAEHWEANGDKTLSLDDLLERCEVVTIGVDGGGLDDLLGLAVMGRETKTGNWLLWSRAWAHPSVLERRKEIAPRIKDFAKDDQLSIVQKPGEDVDELAAIVEQVEASGLLDRIGVDPAGIGAIVDAIVDKKIEHERIVGIPQGWKMVGAIKTAERKLAARQLKHGATPMMAWCAGNAKVIPAGNAVLITKQVSGSAKIDPLMAMFNAVALMAMNPKPRKKQYQFFTIG